MQLPRLFKTTKTGATQICDISAKNGKFTVTFGQLGGKLQSKTTTCIGKNIGKSNSTTPHGQAQLEAQSKWDSKVKSGYTTDQSAPVSVQLPQKVKAYVGNESKIVFPAYSTFKYNGVNATYWLQDDGTLKLTSRGGNEYPAIPHLEPYIRALLAILKTDCVNGELYIHGQHLQDITSAVKKPKELSKQLTFNFFEFPNLECDNTWVNPPYTKHSFKYKVVVLQLLSNNVKFNNTCKVIGPNMKVFKDNIYVKPVQIQLVNNAQELEDHYNLAISQGYEGTVIYNADAEYKFNERSSSVYKYKKAQDAEFQVIAYEFDKNDHVVYTCKTPQGLDFKVKRKGTNAERELDAQNAPNNLGKWLTVSFEVYSKAQVPLKPVGLNFRNCDINGDPLE